MLVVFEGADGLGKSTQVRMLATALIELGRDVAVYDFPAKSGGFVGDLIGGFLRGEYGSVPPEFLSLAFSLDRFSSARLIGSDLSAGKIVICDRYVMSNAAFQVAKIADPDRARGLERMIFRNEYDLLRLPVPDLELLFVADDEYFSQGEHLARGDLRGREYIGTGTDVHEGAFQLQVDVDRYYRSQAPSGMIEMVPIFDSNRSRLSASDIHQTVLNAVKAKF